MLSSAPPALKSLTLLVFGRDLRFGNRVYSCISLVSTRFSLSVENDQNDAGRDGRTCLARRPNSQARTGNRDFVFIFSCSGDHEQDYQPYPVDPYSALYVMAVHSEDGWGPFG